jgi:peptidoglycan/xylan/chitin deacetylase (PgdA/CDA1 family)
MPDQPIPLSIVFDDGFVASSLKTADLFESFGLRAVFSVLADTTNFAPHLKVGDFALWNELQARGHIIHPHGWRHTNLSQVPHEQAIDELRRCLDAFGENLNGFDPKLVVYHYAYNCSTPALNDWLLPRVAAVREGGSGFITREQLASRVWHSTTFGPGDPADDLMLRLKSIPENRPAGFMYSLHGIDREGWGAIALDSLRKALETMATDTRVAFRVPP